MTYGNQVVEEMIGLYVVTISSEYVDPRGRYHRFQNSFTIEVYSDDEVEEEELPELTPFEEAEVDLELIEFTGLVHEKV